jgi:hypothetical protein
MARCCFFNVPREDVMSRKSMSYLLASSGSALLLASGLSVLIAASLFTSPAPLPAPWDLVFVLCFASTWFTGPIGVLLWLMSIANWKGSPRTGQDR